jgi:hypothetical protein
MTERAAARLPGGDCNPAFARRVMVGEDIAGHGPMVASKPLRRYGVNALTGA